MAIRTVTDAIRYVGVDDNTLALFENQYPVQPMGVSYNSYVILDEKIAVMDSVDARAAEEWLSNVARVLEGRRPDYLVVTHMEPDHSGSLMRLAQKYPEMKIVGNAKTFTLIKQFFGTGALSEERMLEVGEGSTISLGSHRLRFLLAPMVHWPEVMMTFDTTTGTLFSADAFGTFGALEGALFADEVDFAGKWLDDARRYYTNIVGKYGVQVQAVLKKAATLPIETIAPLHGPVWRKNLGWFIGKYDLWSRCEPEEKAVVVLYGSMYGNTASAANALAAKVAAKGVKVAVHDLSCIDNSEAVAECWRASTIVLAAPTYNGGIYLPAANLLEDLKALNLHDRTFALVENGSWAPMSAKLMAAKIGELKNCTVLDAKVTVRGRLTATQDAELEACAAAVAASM